MSFAPPVGRDGFYFNGELYVETGNLNRHKRASIPEITSILRPDLKKPKNAPAASPKDPVGHWYEAQLIHYGLPPSKDKARAKMRLLEALNGSKLVVPATITKLEADLKKEYAAADRKAKALYKAGLNATDDGGPSANSKKRKQSEPTNSINVNINFGAYGPQFGGGAYSMDSTSGNAQDEAPSKKAKKSTATNAAPAKMSNAKATPDPATKAPRPKQTARRSLGPPGQKSLTQGRRLDDEDIAMQFAMADRVLPEKPTKKAPAKNTAKPQIPPKTKKETPVKQESSTCKPAKPTPTPKKEPTVKKETSVKKEPKVKKETAIKNEPSSPYKPKLGLINGHYDIHCPTVEQEWPDYAQDMSLVLTLDSPGLWGAYDFGIFEGILRLNTRPWEPSSEGIQCSWRGRENGEGEMSFGDHCQGEVVFWGDGRIEGWLSLYGRCDFVGVRRPGPGTPIRSAGSMRQEWDGYDEDAYEEERRGRW